MRRLLSALVSVVLVASLAACSQEPIEADQARTPSSSSDFEDKDFQEVVDALSEVGFTNVETKALGDLITGWLNQPGTVKEVEIAGKSDFGRGDVFQKDELIVVSYHSFPQEETSKPSPSASPGTPSLDTGVDGNTGLASRARARFLEAWGVETELDLYPIYLTDPVAPTYAIYQWEEVAGWVRVYVQENVSQDVALFIGRQVLGLTCDQVDLDGVIVRGIDGVDINVPKSEMPLCN